MAKPVPTFEDELIEDEGLRLTVYVDTRGNRSIGVGHNLENDSSLDIHNAELHGWTLEKAHRVLAEDIAEADRLLAHYMPTAANHDWVRHRVLRNMIFNMGWGNGKHGLSSFKNTLEHFRNGRYAEAALGMSKSDWAKQVPNRAKRLIDRMRSGRYWPEGKE